MKHPTLAKHENLATMPYRKIKVKNDITHILHLLCGQRILIYSSGNGSFRVWDLERNRQFGKEWKDKEREVEIIALSLDGKRVATGSPNGAVKLWSIDTGKVIKTLTGHTKKVDFLCWNPDGGRVVSGESWNGNFRVWDVESEETIVGPIKTGLKFFEMMYAVCYSPNGKMIVTAGSMGLRVWDANTGELLKTLDREDQRWCLAWTSDGKALFGGGSDFVKKLDTATWTVETISNRSKYPSDEGEHFVETILISPNQRILASTSSFDKTAVQLSSFDTNQPIGTLLHHEGFVNSATFAANGKFLVTHCGYHHIYIWDVSAVLKEAGLLLDNVVSCTIPPSHLGSKHGIRKTGLVIEAQCLMEPRNYHARKKASGSSRPPNTYVIPTGTLQGTASSLQQPLTTATATGTSSYPDIIITRAGWWTWFLLWIGCVSF